MPLLKMAEGSAHYALSGKDEAGCPGVLIHGAGGCRLDWPAELRRLDGRPTYTLDLPGHGRSDGPAKDSISAYRQWVLQLLDHLMLEQAVLVGHSMGAGIALDVALEAPKRVAGLILIGAGARLRVAPALLEMLLKEPAQAVRTVIEWAYGPLAGESMREAGRQRMALVDSEVLHADFLACDRFDVRDRLVLVEVPTLLICGTEDRMTPAKYSQYLHEQIPDSELALIEGAGHMVMHERSREVAEAVRRFLERLGSLNRGD